ncbi:hypothetical protein [Desulfolutivibrio sulfoxidireducens]|uniref:hypothetical protein n=1 Tax=Desulfolutivibrio sulfoxidireducens TaxID=2773299 RepID=UPI00159DCCC3|nr:hypothetical protein [Desulfolutivibrio sulfoxidireducens]QLA17643.1 hypothetical protein GD605_16935 [Desulfolutivibrio sulfoxidireducens]
MKLNRASQLEFLTKLRDMYPEGLSECFDSDNDFDTTGNLFYLLEHGLIKASAVKDKIGSRSAIANIKITAKGIDFLEDDGGINAILKKITVKIDCDSIKELLFSTIQSQDMQESEKSRLKKGSSGLSVLFD